MIKWQKNVHATASDAKKWQKKLLMSENFHRSLIKNFMPLSKISQRQKGEHGVRNCEKINSLLGWSTRWWIGSEAVKLCVHKGNWIRDCISIEWCEMFWGSWKIRWQWTTTRHPRRYQFYWQSFDHLLLFCLLSLAIEDWINFTSNWCFDSASNWLFHHVTR